jgi:hypothetical protein
MSILGILKSAKNWRLLPPKDKEFYLLFDEITATLIEAGEKLVELFNCHPRDRQVIGVTIETCFTRCARGADQIEALLKKSQQPPFDRSDISEFADGVAKTMKYLNHAANRYLIYDFPSSDQEMRELAPILYEACQEIAKAVKALQKDRNIEPYTRAIGSLEAKADEIYHEGLRRRFHEIRTDRVNLETRIQALTGDVSAKDLVPIIQANVQYTRHAAVFFILRQVYEELERAIDSCTLVAANLQRMVAENV